MTSAKSPRQRDTRNQIPSFEVPAVADVPRFSSTRRPSDGSLFMPEPDIMVVSGQVQRVTAELEAVVQARLAPALEFADTLPHVRIPVRVKIT